MAKNQSFNISLKLFTTQFSKGIRSVQKQLRTFGNFIKSTFAIGSLTIFGRKMVEIGAEFENQMARVKSITNASSKEFKMMSDEARRLGETTKYTATEAAQALENLTRNGLSATKATKVLSSVLQLAQANGIGLAESADIITNTMNMFGLSVEDVSRVNDVLSSTAANSATNISLLYESLVNAAPAAHTLGFNIEETAAAMGALAQRGVKGAEAGTQLRMALTKMADPKIISKMNEMGIAIDEQTMREEGLLKTINKLKDAQLSLTDLVGIFSQRGAVGIQQLINSYSDFEYLVNITRESAGTTSRMFNQSVGSTKQKIDVLRSTFESFLISISNKTRGVVNGVIGYLAHLIKSFNTVGGTIKNVALVVIPLLGAQFTKLVRAVKTGCVSMKAAIESVKMATIVGVVSAAIDGAIMLIDGLTARSRDLKREMKSLETETALADKSFEKLSSSVKVLMLQLEANGKNSLPGIVKQLVDLFPDFADAIKQAGMEANKTGNYEKLKSVLGDIVKLQSTMLSNQANRKLYESYLNTGGYKMRTAKKSDKEKAGLGSLSDYFKKNDVSKDVQESIYSAILDLRITGASDNLIKDYIESISGGQATLNSPYGFNTNMITGLTEYISKGRGLNNAYQKNLTDSARKELELQAKQLGVEINEAFTNDDISKQIAAKQKEISDQKNAELKAANEAEANERVKAENAKEVAKVDESLKETISDVTDDLANEIIDNKQAIKTLTQAYQKAYEDIRKLTGQKGSANPYFENYKGLTTGTKGLRVVLGLETKELIPVIENALKKGAESQAPQLNAQDAIGNKVINLDNIGIDKAISQMDTFNGLVWTAAGGVTGIANAFETLGDSESKWTDKLQAGLSILSSTAAILETINTITKVGTALSAGQLAVEGELASTKIAQAIASIFKANGEIPIAGIAIATAGVAALIAALASAPRFAEGGIVGGSKMHGDMNIARVNGGEMILNGTQQKNLWKMINNTDTGTEPNQIQFKIKGKDLVASINNYNKAIKPTVSVL